MDSSSANDSSPSHNYTRWCDKRFTNMYSHNKFSPNRRQYSPKPSTSSMKTLYTTSEERILANTDRKVHQEHSTRRVVEREVMNDGTRKVVEKEVMNDSTRMVIKKEVINDVNSYDSTTDDDDLFGCRYQIKSVVTKVLNSESAQRNDTKENGRKTASDHHDEENVSEGSRPPTPDGGVSKRCLRDLVPENEANEGKVNKKKHKRHEMIFSSITTNVKVESSKDRNYEERSNKKRRSKTEHNKDNECHSENRKVENERVVKDKKSEDLHLRQGSQSPSSSSSRKCKEEKSSNEISKKSDQKVSSDTDMPMLEEDLTDSQPKETKSSYQFNPKPFKMFLPPAQAQTIKDEDKNNNDSPQQSTRTSASDNRTKQVSSQDSDTKSTHRRTSSTSSASSTSTSASNVSSTERVSHTENEVHSNVTRTSSVKMVSFKTAKHLHKKPRRVKEAGGDNKGMSKESTKKQVCNPKIETYADKATGSKKKPVKHGKAPDACVVLNHIKKAFSNSCTDSESDGSPLPKSSLTQHVTKSLAASVIECTDAVQSSASEKSRDGSEKRAKSSGEDILSRLPVKPFSVDAIVKKSEVKEVMSNKGATTGSEFETKNEQPLIEQEDANLNNSERKPGQLFSQPPTEDNTTYKLHSPASLACKFDNPMEIDSRQSTSPKQLASSTINEANKSETIASSVSDVKAKDSTERKDNTIDASNVEIKPEEKMPELEEYGVESGELSSDDSEDDSWSQMVEQVTGDKKGSQWNLVMDSQRQRLCIEGTTYAAPPLHWRTSWHWHGDKFRPPLLPPQYPPPRFPPPPLMGLPPPPPPPPPHSLYQQASQKMYNPTANNPFHWRNPSALPQSSASSSRPERSTNSDTSWRSREPETPWSSLRPEKTAEGDFDWRSKEPKKDVKQDEDLDGEIYYSSDEEETYDSTKPYLIPQRRPPTDYYSYKENPKNLPPRLLRQQQQQQQQYTPTSSYRSSPWTPSSYQNDQRQRNSGDSSNVVVSWDQDGNFTSPQSSSWTGRKSFSPGTPFEYDTSSIMYPYSMRDYIDTHCHIDFLYQRLSYRGTFQKFSTTHHFPPNYAGCVAIFCTPESVNPYGIWKELMNEDKIWGAFGIHPHHTKYYDGRIEDNVMSCMKHPKAVALGEIGLDYSNRNSSDWILQQEVFRRQLGIALKLKKPLVIHSRDAEDDTINIMASMVPSDYPIHRHCFTGTPEEAHRWFSYFPKSFIGLTALVTFPTAFPTHRTAQEIPLDRLLLETDAPYFLPRQCPRTLKYANPSMAVFVAERIARLRGITTDEVLVAVRKNTKMMYGV